MQLLKLFQTEIADRFTRENFARIERFFRDDVVSKTQLTFFEYTVANRGTFPLTLEVKHSMSFVPKDVITLYIGNPDGNTVTWNYDAFTRTHLSFTVSAACTIRALVGRYGEN